MLGLHVPIWPCGSIHNTMAHLQRLSLAGPSSATGFVLNCDPIPTTLADGSVVKQEVRRRPEIKDQG